MKPFALFMAISCLSAYAAAGNTQESNGAAVIANCTLLEDIYQRVGDTIETGALQSFATAMSEEHTQTSSPARYINTSMGLLTENMWKVLKKFPGLSNKISSSTHTISPISSIADETTRDILGTRQELDIFKRMSKVVTHCQATNIKRKELDETLEYMELFFSSEELRSDYHYYGGQDLSVSLNDIAEDMKEMKNQLNSKVALMFQPINPDFEPSNNEEREASAKREQFKDVTDMMILVLNIHHSSSTKEDLGKLYKSEYDKITKQGDHEEVLFQTIQVALEKTLEALL
ncbi:MAG: hypothetical protein ACR2PT_12910 [Endozoicomonas sp.]